MVDVPVWACDWVHECCGETRRVGDAVDLELTFAGDTAPAAGPDRVDVLGDGRVCIIGTVAGPFGLDEGHTEGTRIASATPGGVLPSPSPASLRRGYLLDGWFAAADDGDRCRPGLGQRHQQLSTRGGEMSAQLRGPALKEGRQTCRFLARFSADIAA
jgi:hypothetical protein